MAQSHSLPVLKLNDGTSIPMLGYGIGSAWFKSNGPEEQIDRTLVDAIKKALELGYRHFDNAEVYRTELEFGVALKESGVPREELYITTKVLGSIGDIEAAIKTSLKKLQVSYVDQYLIHAPYFANGDEAKLQQAWAGMEKVKEAGLTKTIGLSNFLPQDIEAIVKTAKVIPAINQIEFHPYLQRHEITKTNRKYGITTSAYGPLSPITKGAPGPVDDFLNALAKKYAVTPGEVLLRWAIEQDVVPITTSSKEQRLIEYLRIKSFKLTPEEIRTIAEQGDQKHHRVFWTNKFDANDRT